MPLKIEAESHSLQIRQIYATRQDEFVGIWRKNHLEGAIYDLFQLPRARSPLSLKNRVTPLSGAPTLVGQGESATSKTTGDDQVARRAPRLQALGARRASPSQEEDGTSSAPIRSGNRSTQSVALAADTSRSSSARTESARARRGPRGGEGLPLAFRARCLP
jgi:hypothetical protein